MAASHEEHAHQHQFVEIIGLETISAFEQVPHEVIILQLHQRGFSLDLTYVEATALGKVMAKVAEHVKARQRT